MSARGAGNYARFTEDEKTLLREMRAEGCSIAAMAVKLGMTEKRIQDWFRLSRDAWLPPKDRQQKRVVLR